MYDVLCVNRVGHLLMWLIETSRKRYTMCQVMSNLEGLYVKRHYL